MDKKVKGQSHTTSRTPCPPHFKGARTSPEKSEVALLLILFQFRGTPLRPNFEMKGGRGNLRLKIPFVSLSIYSPISRVVSQPTSSKKNPYGRRPAFTHCGRLAVTSQASNRRLTPEGLRNPSPRDQPTLREASQYGRLAAEPPDGAWLATAPSGSSPHVPPPAQQSTRQSQDNPQDNPKHDAKWTFDSLLFERKNIYFLFPYRKPPNVDFVPCFELSCGLSCDCLVIVL